MKIKTFVNQRAFSCNVYVCSAGECSFIVDLGYYDSEIENYLKTIPPVKFVLQTHGHFDHIMGINAFAEQYPEAEFFCHKNELQVLSDYRINSSYMAGEAYLPDVNFKTLEEGIVNIHNLEIKVIYTMVPRIQKRTFLNSSRLCLCQMASNSTPSSFETNCT